MKGQTTTITNPDDGQKKDFTFDYSFWSYDGFEELEDGYGNLSPKPGCNFADQKKVFWDFGRDVLGNVISALSDQATGKLKRGQIAALSPAGGNYEETLATLKFADRVKLVHNSQAQDETLTMTAESPVTLKAPKALKRLRLTMQRLTDIPGLQTLGKLSRAILESNESLEALRLPLKLESLSLVRLERLKALEGLGGLKGLEDLQIRSLQRESLKLPEIGQTLQSLERILLDRCKELKHIETASDAEFGKENVKDTPMAFTLQIRGCVKLETLSPALYALHERGMQFEIDDDSKQSLKTPPREVAEREKGGGSILGYLEALFLDMQNSKGGKLEEGHSLKVTFVGHGRAGKSTLLRALCG
uniref:Kinesin motor domain-containing protein n=1 Tax=Chromera velia CCMP2878 TaxID=1169474 RepID=A0A0G4IEM3_9ALVE|eukprot:Cvel_13686.t1-p1 / transcript=Cvel_13686.t1 / gene=Cvel_13686 / organism=Chromera_velia_CCMP2878 / gene_product=hypothetical protein / transcript_product=hypothetical protein / location=Cvel_scaffold945:40560-51944(-) / protein_length=360 / sequence_SO=supercontig / SO=protein_coding / is_pseudo=false